MWPRFRSDSSLKNVDVKITEKHFGILFSENESRSREGPTLVGISVDLTWVQPFSTIEIQSHECFNNFMLSFVLKINYNKICYI